MANVTAQPGDAQPPEPPARDPHVITRAHFQKLARMDRLADYCRRHGFTYQGADIVGDTATLR